MSARSVFLRDQNEAASADAAKTLRDAAARLGDPAQDRRTGPYTTELVRQLQDRYLRGLQPTCEHLGAVPAVAVFIVSRPERLLCDPCAAHASEACNDEPGCDVCGARAPLRRAVWALGPLFLAYTICDACYWVEVAG
jgi:plasmid stabilization system protein ParE